MSNTPCVHDTTVWSKAETGNLLTLDTTGKSQMKIHYNCACYQTTTPKWEPRLLNFLEYSSRAM